MRIIIVFVLFGSFLVSFCEKARFDNYRVYSIQIENDEQLKVLQGLESNQDGLVFIEAPISTASATEILVPPHKLADIKDLFEKFNMKSDIKFENFQRFVQK